jgi:DNA invertase Pin-like site-specific DNA recombinase
MRGSSLAKVEAQKISDRTKAGMARAKAKGLNLNVLRRRNANGGYHNLIVAQHRICPNCDALKPKLT